MIELESRFYDSTQDDPREYSAGQWSEVFAFLAGNGVMPGEGTEFKVTEYNPVQMKVNVGAGVCFIKGRYGRLTNATELAIPDADPTYDRIDRIVLKLDLNTNARKTTLEVKQGTPAETPAPPSLERTETVHEISIAQIYVTAGTVTITNSDITDEKNNYDVCGFSLPFGWLVNQRIITAPREDIINRDANGDITNTEHYIPNQATGVLRWKEIYTRDSDGNIIQVDRYAYADDGVTIVLHSTEVITRDANGNIIGVVTT